MASHRATVRRPAPVPPAARNQPATDAAHGGNGYPVITGAAREQGTNIATRLRNRSAGRGGGAERPLARPDRGGSSAPVTSWPPAARDPAPRQPHRTACARSRAGDGAPPVVSMRGERAARGLESPPALSPLSRGRCGRRLRHGRSKTIVRPFLSSPAGPTQLPCPLPRTALSSRVCRPLPRVRSCPCRSPCWWPQLPALHRSPRARSRPTQRSTSWCRPRTVLSHAP